MLCKVILDSGAQNSIFSNIHLLSDVREKVHPAQYSGIAKNGQSVVSTHEGKFYRIPVDYAPDAGANVLSHSQLLRLGATIDYVDDVFQVGISDQLLRFTLDRGLYTLNSEQDVASLTRKQVNEVELAQEIQKRLGFPAKSGVEAFIFSGAMLNVPIGTRAAGFLPESIPNLQGKTVEKRVKVPPEIKSEVKVKTTRLHVDLFYLTDDIEQRTLPFFASVTDFGLMVVKSLSSRGTKQVQSAIAEVLTLMKRHNICVEVVKSDGEDSIPLALDNVAGPPHLLLSPGKHDGYVDERIRRLKEIVRAISVSLRYRLGFTLTQWCVIYSAYVLNLIPFREAQGASPRETFTGIKPNFPTHLPISVGVFAQVKEKTKNDLTPRTVTALSLLPTGDDGVKFASLLSGRVLYRNLFVEVQNIPYEWLVIVNRLQERGELGVEGMIDNPGSEPNNVVLIT